MDTGAAALVVRPSPRVAVTTIASANDAVSSVTRVEPSEATTRAARSPAASTVSRSPGLAQSSENTPSTPVSTRQSARLVVRTVAPATGAPEASRTTPVTVEPRNCRRACEPNRLHANTNDAKGRHRPQIVTHARARRGVSPHTPASNDHAHGNVTSDGAALTMSGSTAASTGTTTMPHTTLGCVPHLSTCGRGRLGALQGRWRRKQFLERGRRAGLGATAGTDSVCTKVASTPIVADNWATVWPPQRI